MGRGERVVVLEFLRIWGRRVLFGFGFFGNGKYFRVWGKELREIFRRFLFIRGVYGVNFC